MKGINSSYPFYFNYFSLKEHLNKVEEIYNQNFSGDSSIINKKLLYSFKYLFENKSSKKLKIIFKKVFEKCSETFLKDFITEVFYESFNDEYKNIDEYLFSFISLERLETICKNMTHSSIENLAETVTKFFTNEKNSKIKKTFLQEFRKTFAFIFNFLPNIINTFLIAFSLFDIGKEPQTAWEASSMLDVYYKFIMIPAAIVVVLSVLLPVVGFKLYAIAAAIVILAAVFLFIYIKWIRPCPNRLPHATNLTEDAKFGRMQTVVGRNQEIDKLISQFSSLENNVSKHVILVGPSGIGKTEIVKGFVQKIFNSKNYKNKSIQHLKKKKIFSINTASIINGGKWGFADQLTYLISRIKGYEKEVILFFDEIHAAFKDHKSTISEFLKPLLDRGGIHCIAATTTEEYNKFISKDTAFCRRFERINITEMKDNAIKEVLQTLIKDWKEKIFIEDETLDKVIYKTNAVKKKLENSASFQQPAFAVQVLTQVIKKCSSKLDENFIPTELSTLKSRLRTYKMTMSDDVTYFPNTKKGKKILIKIKKIKCKISKIKEDLKKRATLIKDFKKISLMYAKKLKIMKKQASKAVNIKRNSKALKAFYWNYNFLIPTLKEKLNQIKEASKDKYPIWIIDQMIDQTISEIVKNNLHQK